MRNPLGVALSLCLFAAACSRPHEPAVSVGPVPGPTPTVERTSIGDLPDVDIDAVLTHTRTLSSDEFQGRAPGTRGEDLTVAYITDQFRRMGLRPGNTDGTYVQRVPLIGLTPAPSPLTLRKGNEQRQFAWKDDVVAWTTHQAPSAAVDESEIVFVGYGVEAPEYDWDDYKGMDLRGKTLLMLVNDPPVPDPANETELDPKVFGGRAMTYYGRWTYKFEMAAEKGAAAAFIVHETEAAGYPFSVIQARTGEQFGLVAPDHNLSWPAVQGWVTLERARDLLRMAGQDFGTLKARAATREFRPVPLGIRASMTLNNTMRRVESRNVIARLDGRDPVLRTEFVAYTAHWDGLGIGPAVNGDIVYNGAVDNAIGVGGLIETARAFTKLPTPPKRSVIFLATTAEEQGLLGSEYYTDSPVYPLARTAAAINIDGLNVNGRTSDVLLVGFGDSELDDYVRDAAGEQGRLVRADPEPEKGYIYRSDHFNFAAHGVPVVAAQPGMDFLGKPKGYGDKVRTDYNMRDYHQPSDIVRPDWDLTGAREDLKILFAVGYRVAEADRMPQWKKGSEFSSSRDQSDVAK
jgi:Zn-dependent M28 family amino/carboxypeptidase